jgi:hypothetical protein
VPPVFFNMYTPSIYSSPVFIFCYLHTLNIFISAWRAACMDMRRSTLAPYLASCLLCACPVVSFGFSILL